jgi:hypothetical protein
VSFCCPGTEDLPLTHAFPLHHRTERLRLEEEERKRLEELERQRQQLLEEFLAEEASRCQSEREELVPLMGQIELGRSRAAEERRKDWEWERYLRWGQLTSDVV